MMSSLHAAFERVKDSRECKRWARMSRVRRRWAYTDERVRRPRMPSHRRARTMNVRGTYGSNRPFDQRRRLPGAQRDDARHRQDSRPSLGRTGRDLRFRRWLSGPHLQTIPQDDPCRLQRHPHARRHDLGHEPHTLQAPRYSRGRRRGQGRRHEGDLSRTRPRLPVHAGRQRFHQDCQPLGAGGPERDRAAQDHRQ